MIRSADPGASLEVIQRQPTHAIVGVPVTAQRTHIRFQRLVLFHLRNIKVADVDASDRVPVSGHLEAFGAHRIGLGGRDQLTTRLFQFQGGEPGVERSPLTQHPHIGFHPFPIGHRGLDLRLASPHCTNGISTPTANC